MKGKEKTKEQLQNELMELRQQITELQKSEIKHQQIEETLGKNEEKYRILVELATDGILMETVEGRILESNTAGAKTFGYTKEEMIGLTLTDLVPEEFSKKLPKIITDKETTHGIFVLRISKKKDGTIFPTEIASKIVNVAGKLRLIAYIRDISKRKKAEKKLKKTRKMFSSLFNSSPEAVLYHDKEGRILNINLRFTELFGYTSKEMIGRNIDEGMIYPTDKIKEGKILTRKAFNGFSNYETIRKKKDGTLVPVIISSAPVIIDKKAQGTLALYRNITERKENEKLQYVLYNISKAANSPISLDQLYPIIHKELGTIIDTTNFYISLLDEKEGKIYFPYHVDEMEDEFEPQNLESKSLTGYVIRNKRSLLLNYDKIKKLNDEGELLNPGVITKDIFWFGVPLKVEGKVTGAMAVQSYTNPNLYSEKDTKLMEFVSSQVAMAIERKRGEDILRQSQQEFASLFNSSPQALAYLDSKANILNINSRFTELFGYTLEEVKGRNIDDGMIHPPDKMEEAKKLTNKSLKGHFYYETVRKKKDGTLFPVAISGSRVIIDCQFKGMIGTFKDITERKKFEDALHNSQQEFASLFHSSPEALAYLDSKSNILNINPRFTDLFGYTLEEIKGKNINKGIIHPPGKIEEGKNLDKIALSEGYFNYESIRKKKDGTLFPVSISGSNIVIDGQLKGVIGVYIDITERKKMEEELEKLAHFDTLTCCCNRGYGMGLLEQQIKLAHRKKYPLLLVYIDIDDFKYINDTFGHKEGDKVLKEVARLFKSTLREVDIICRIGGDEFLLIFPESSLNDAPLIRKRLSKNLEKLNQKLAKPNKIDFSIGLSYYNPANPLSIEELIKIADNNMYKEKKKKKEGF